MGIGGVCCLRAVREMSALRAGRLQGGAGIWRIDLKTMLLIAAHGSPIADANADWQLLAENVRTRNIFDRVEVCFLECNEPSIPEAIDACIQAGASRLTV